ncbi:DUF2027 domain-containing protein [soil metagenome]
MNLLPGEKVRFLNEAIEGVVTKILNNDRVEVTDEFGFTHTAPSKYLVRIEFRMDENLRAPKPKEDTKMMDQDTRRPAKPASIISSLDADETIYGAIILQDSDSPLSSDIELRLVNNSSSAVTFTVARRDDELRIGVTAGVLKSKNEILIGVFSQDELHRFNGFIFQFLFFSEGIYKPRPSAEKSLKFSSSDFVEGENWDVIKHRDQKTLLMPLYLMGREADVDMQKLIDRYEMQKEEIGKRREQPESSGKKRKTEKFVILNKEKVVDLHIEELLKDFHEMSNSQIIAYQLKKFQYEMDQAIINHYYKIIFIHGVGEGILKSAIREELKKYADIKFSEAPYEKFGHGATEVIFS